MLIKLIYYPLYYPKLPFELNKYVKWLNMNGLINTLLFMDHLIPTPNSPKTIVQLQLETKYKFIWKIIKIFNLVLIILVDYAKIDEDIAKIRKSNSYVLLSLLCGMLNKRVLRLIWLVIWKN